MENNWKKSHPRIDADSTGLKVDPAGVRFHFQSISLTFTSFLIQKKKKKKKPPHFIPPVDICQLNFFFSLLADSGSGSGNGLSTGYFLSISFVIIRKVGFVRLAQLQLPLLRPL